MTSEQQCIGLMNAQQKRSVCDQMSEQMNIDLMKMEQKCMKAICMKARQTCVVFLNEFWSKEHRLLFQYKKLQRIGWNRSKNASILMNAQYKSINFDRFEEDVHWFSRSLNKKRKFIFYEI